MRCPACSYLESKVVDSRPTDDGASIRRRRECLKCGYRFTTYEKLGESPFIIIKSDGSSEAYDRDKLFRGLLIACTKRPITPDELTSLIDSIESELRNLPKNEISSKDLGNLALAHLGKLDEVAYVRFASVYKDFQSIEQFSAELEKLRQ